MIAIPTERPFAAYARTACAVAASLALAAPLHMGSAQAWSYEEAAQPYQGIQINILDEITPLQETFSTLIPEFEELTGITVNYQLLNHFEVINRGQADMLSGRGEYDAVMNHSFQLGLLLDAGVLRPLDDLVANTALTNPELDIEDLIDPAFSTLAFHDGNMYSFIQWNYNTVYWARKDLLEHPDEQAAFEEKYGYPLKPAETFQELRDIAEFFTRSAGETLAGETLSSDFYGMVMEGLNGGTTYETVWYVFIRNSGGDIFDAEGRPTFETPEVIEGLRRWADLWQFSPPGQAEYSLIDVPTVMGNGIAAQAIAWSDFVLGIDRPGASALAGSFTYGPTPRSDDPDQQYYGAGEPSAYNISIHSQQPEATYLFLQWAVDPETQARLLDAGGGVPVRQSSWPRVVESAEPNMADLYQAMQGSLSGIYATPKAPRFLEISDVINRVAQQVGLGQLTPEEGARQMQQDVLNICSECLL